MITNFDTSIDDYEQSLENEVAVHEAGHAVMAYLLEMPFTYVTLPDESGVGHMSFPVDPDSEHHLNTFRFDHPGGFAPFGFGNRHDTLIRPEVRDYVESLMLVCAAGTAAEVLYTGDDLDEYWLAWELSSDNRQFTELARSVTASDEELEHFRIWMFERARTIMRVPAHVIVVEELAHQLKLHRKLQYDQARDIIKSAFKELSGPVLEDRMYGRSLCGESR
jgi:hypothetical protein